MKYIADFLIFLILTGVYSCHTNQSTYPPQMALADSLMDFRPDSALSILSVMKNDIAHAPEATLRYYQLLTIKAQDKCFITHTSDSLMKEVVSYYDRHGTSLQKAEAYYYLGSVYRDMGYAPKAINCFQQTIELIKNDSDYKAYKLSGLTYSQMGTLFFYQNLPDEGIEAYRQSYQYALQTNDSIPLIHRMGNMARIYTTIGDADSTIYYYNSAISIAKQIGKHNLQSDYQLELAGIYIDVDSLEKAQSLLTKNRHNDVYFLLCGKMYKKDAMLDSAYFYFHKAIQSENIYVKSSAYKQLYQIEKEYGKEKQTLYYLEQANLCRDSIQRITDAEGTKKAEALYTYQLYESENNRLALKIVQQKARTTRIGMLALILLACITIYIRDEKRKKREMKEQAHRSLFFLQEQYQHTLSESSDKILRLENQLKEAKQVKQEKQINEFQGSELFWQLVQDSTFKMKDKDWKVLQEEIDKVYDQFSIRLFVLYPKLTEIELRVCLLVKAGLPLSDIARLVHREANSISSLRERLYKKVHGKAGAPKDLDRFLADF